MKNFTLHNFSFSENVFCSESAMFHHLVSWLDQYEYDGRPAIDGGRPVNGGRYPDHRLVACPAAADQAGQPEGRSSGLPHHPPGLEGEGAPIKRPTHNKRLLYKTH